MPIERVIAWDVTLTNLEIEGLLMALSIEDDLHGLSDPQIDAQAKLRDAESTLGNILRLSQ